LRSALGIHTVAQAGTVQLDAGMRRYMIASLALLPSFADAGPFAIGVGLGATKSDTAVASSGDTLGLFGRVALSPHWGAQLEVQRTDLNASEKQLRAGSALMVLDGRSGNVVPVLLAGLGFDRGTWESGTTDGHHFEAGIGLELRTHSGFFLGADARAGEMVIDSKPAFVIAPLCPASDCTMDTLRPGVYHSLRATAGMRF
jgi:hypothetical protein